MRTAMYYELPSDLAVDIDAYQSEVERFLAGELPAAVLKARRVPRGVYEQRQDGAFMVRVRVAGGTLRHEQTRELAALSREFGNGLLHVTTRQDVQLHDISIEDTPRVMRRLMGVGLTSKGGGGNTVRNITACPYAGICPCEHFDVTPLVHAVTEYLIPLVGSYNLPRKYKIAFSGCAADCALAWVADLGFIAEMRDGVPGFRVVAGGGMGAQSRVADELLAWTPAREVIRIAEAVRRLFDQLGDRSNKHRARLRYVFERLGPDEVRTRFARELQAVEQEGVPECLREVLPNNTRNSADCAPPVPEFTGAIRAIRQRQDDLVAIPLHLPLGFVSAEDFATIGALAEQFSDEDGLRTTRAQNLLIRFVRPEHAEALGNELRKLKADVLSPVPLERFVACAGASTCRLGLCLAREAARACAERLRDDAIGSDTLDSMDIYINGCPNACGHQPVGAIGFYGVAQRVAGRLIPCYRITLGGCCGVGGGRLGVSVGQVPAKALPALLSDLAKDFAAGRAANESFVAYFERLGAAHFEHVAERHGRVPGYDEQPEYYRDFGLEEDFSLAGRGAGECGAGVFELIEADLTAAGKAKDPFDRLLPTTRALLITRGVDARDPDTVLREFERHFIDTGLVGEEFRALLTRARGFTQGWQQAFEGCEELVEGLLQRVELLYSTLDASLQFHPPEAAAPAVAEDADTPAPSAPGADDVGQELDLRGVACPMNFVKAKLALEGMDRGEALAIILDDGEPIKNVPASFRYEGQAIEHTSDLGNGHWRVVVRKQQ